MFLWHAWGFLYCIVLYDNIQHTTYNIQNKQPGIKWAKDLNRHPRFKEKCKQKITVYLRNTFVITIMGEIHEYACGQCARRIKQEVPLFEDPWAFGDRVVCGNCGSTQPKQYVGKVW